MRLSVWLLCLAGLLLSSGFALAQQTPRPNILSASFAEPTDRYDHGILGDAIEYGALVLVLDMCPNCALLRQKNVLIRLPKSRVFEDLKPRLADLNGDGISEVIVVETSLGKGASLAVYGAAGKIAATPFLGRPHRWLAPVGAADFDSDGRMEIAYVEKPHLTMILKIWRLEGKSLKQVAKLSGLTNHRIGDDFISGGIRTCFDQPEIITVNRDWSQIMATQLVDGKLSTRARARFTGQASLKAMLNC